MIPVAETLHAVADMFAVATVEEGRYASSGRHSEAYSDPLQLST